MNCVCCDGIAKRRGFYSNKNFNVQRFECLKCGTSFSEKQPLDNLRVDYKQACQVLNLLSEGMGIRATSRLTGLHQQTVLNVLARAGSKAGRFLDATVRNVKPESIQADEMYCFVQTKERPTTLRDPFRGEQFLFLAIDSGSKLIISHLVGKRTVDNTAALLRDVRARVPDHFQISTDGFPAYRTMMFRSVGPNVDFAQEVKIFEKPSEKQNRYSPAKCIGTRIHVRRGNPNPDLISTSFVERTNLSVRTFNRRFTRLTLGYSKKIEYLIHSINLMVFHFNFVRVHGTHKQTPAQAAKLTDHVWSFDELLSLKGY